MSNLTDLMRAEAEVLRLKSYRQIDDEAAVDLIHETRERALKAEAEVAALKRVVAAADAMRDMGVSIGQQVVQPEGMSEDYALSEFIGLFDGPFQREYDAARAALKEGK